LQQTPLCPGVKRRHSLGHNSLWLKGLSCATLLLDTIHVLGYN